MGGLATWGGGGGGIYPGPPFLKGGGGGGVKHQNLWTQPSLNVHYWHKSYGKVGNQQLVYFAYKLLSHLVYIYNKMTLVILVGAQKGLCSRTIFNY